MNTKIIEATNGEKNWGKFLLGQFDEDEWARRSIVSPGMWLVQGVGWSPSSTLVLDLQTGEGAIFSPGGVAKADLTKHRVWVCPLFEPFLEWLYTRVDTSRALNLATLPDYIDLPTAQFEWHGHRRPGPQCPACERPL